MKRKMKKKILLLSCILLLAFPNCCKIPTVTDSPEKVKDEVEILYQRVLPVINPWGSDPSRATIWNEQWGGKNSSYFIQSGENQWIAEVTLLYSRVPYYICTIDRKVETTYGEPIARKFFVRIRGSNNWIELTKIEKHAHLGLGEWTMFKIDAKGIRIPE